MFTRFIFCFFLVALLPACGGEDAATPAPEPTPSPQPQPTPPDRAMTDQEAVRLLLHASFGPTDGSVENVAEIGAEAWLEAQFASPVTEHLPLLNSNFPSDEIYSHHWVEIWWQRSIYADDQLRQRVAFSLSQIFVVSTKDARLLVDPRGVTSYYDTLLTHSFGNFRDLLEAVTLHPMMGMYLSMLGNEKPDAERNIRPDENFAREVMQLFTIGLVELNQDGSVVTDSQGNPVATYDQETIKGFAHVFTGWHYAGRASWWDDNYDGQSPMEPYEAFHDRGEKMLLNGTVVPARQNARADLAMALDNLFNHPNVGPFIGKQLIQRLVTSNPSAGYVSRVAAAFNDNGEGVRGDMRAVIEAILLDDEARDINSTSTGKLRNPLLRIAHVMRVFQSRARDGGMGHEFVGLNIGVAPLDSPSVFNFYRPDYSAPGAIREAGLVSPEFQITNEISITRYVNYMFYMAWFNNLRGDEIVEDDVGIVNFDQLAALSDDHDALLDYLNLMLLDGQMNDTMRTVLMDALDYWSQGEADWVKLANVVYLITISPQFAVQQQEPAMQRRDFLKRSLVGLGGASSLWATTSQFNLVNAATSANSFTDYKALVCVFLLGGNDSLNMLIPTDQRAYDQYAATRQNLAVARNAALAINVTNTQYSSVGLHPSLAALHTIYEQGNMALVANVGPMIEPASKADILTGRVMLPPQLFSHSDQQNHWQTAHPQQAALTGWAGRMADMLSDGTEPLSMNLSMAGNNLWQTGSQVLPFALSSQGAEILEGINPDEEWQRPNAAFLDRIHASTEGMFASQFAAMVDRTRTTGGLVNSALALGPELSTAFPATRFAEQMRLVANMISVQQHLNQSRQIYFVAMGGWDTHDNQLADHPTLLSELANGMAAFYNATAELGVSEQVTAFTASDFGRTLTSNGDGTDHGWGGNHIVLGGAVQGADIYGQLPQMSLGSDDDLGDGRIIPTLSVDQYAATLAQWFGLADNELTEILPNLNNFNQHNLGFLAE